MVRAPCCEEMGLKKGPWTAEEDSILIAHIERFGHLNWRALPKQAGLLRCGKSCRLRWTNYLRPDIKRGSFTAEEEETILKLHDSLGNRWSAIAARLPGRTDNEIKNVWHTHLKKRRRDSNPTNARPVHKNLESAPSSPPKQYCTSDFPASTDSCTAENFTPRIKDDDHQIQQVDQDLWLEAEITGRRPEHSPASTSVGPHLQIPLYCSYNDDNMGFWFNLFMQAAGEDPEF